MFVENQNRCFIESGPDTVSRSSHPPGYLVDTRSGTPPSPLVPTATPTQPSPTHHPVARFRIKCCTEQCLFRGLYFVASNISIFHFPLVQMNDFRLTRILADGRKEIAGVKTNLTLLSYNLLLLLMFSNILFCFETTNTQIFDSINSTKAAENDKPVCIEVSSSRIT